MILQALENYYQVLAARGEIALAGWGTAGVSFALALAPDGALLGVQPLKITSLDGKKEVPRPLRVPEPVKRSSGVAANFLCDNSSYLLGADEKGKPARTLQCFAAAQALHHTVLDGVDSPAARAILGYFDSWDPQTALSHPAVAPLADQLMAGANLIFSVDGVWAQEDARVRAAWDAFRSGHAAGREMVCLVTGKRAPAARLHASIKKVHGAQATGASLVSFNAPALESFGKEQADDTGQGCNAPVSESAAFAYTTALNHLLADRDHVQRIGDTTVVFWAKDGEPAYQDVFGASVFGTAGSRITEEDLKSIFKNLAEGNAVDFEGIPLNPENHFYVLGLAPNAARLSVRFFLQDEFGKLLKHVEAHYERLQIVKPAYEKFESLPLWRLLNETVNQKASKKEASPPMAAAVTRAILTGGDYPASLLEAVLIRIRAEREITYGRAAILKAYFLKNRSVSLPEEVTLVRLNEACNYVPYLLGRLFSVYEAIQQEASPGINATIKDKYFNSAAAMPATVFPVLIGLADKHLKKMEKGKRIYWDRVLTGLWSRFEEDLPARLEVKDQGTFYLGYYYQTQQRYTKKENREDRENG